MRQSCDNDEQYADRNHRRATKTRERLLGIKHARHEQHTDSSEKHYITTPFREQQNGKHAQHRYDGYPGIQTKT